MKAYAGIGSRGTPSGFLKSMEYMAEILSDRYILRTGGAPGADSAFIEGAKKNMEIYVPSDGFNGFYKRNNGAVIDEIPEYAFTLAEKYHPTYYKLKPYVKRLMARNCMQILGEGLDNPVEFVICYTEDGQASGGTGQALRIAEDLDIKIYNIKNKQDFYDVKKLL